MSPLKTRNVFKILLLFLTLCSAFSCVKNMNSESSTKTRYKTIIDTFEVELQAYPVDTMGIISVQKVVKDDIPSTFTYATLISNPIIFDVLAMKSSGEGIYIYSHRLSDNDLTANLVRFHIDPKEITTFWNRIYDAGFFNMASEYSANIADGFLRVFVFRSALINQHVRLNNCLPPDSLRVIKAEKGLFPDTTDMRTKPTVIHKEELKALYSEYKVNKYFDAVLKRVE